MCVCVSEGREAHEPREARHNAVEESGRNTTTELGSDTEISDLWRMSALLEFCPKGVRKQMLLQLNESGEHYQTLKATVISHLTNKSSTRQE